MKPLARLPVAALIALVFAAGCSALPGLRVLTGQDAPEVASEQVIELTDLVMADKSGTTDPSLLAAADRIEAAIGNVDIVEIRYDPGEDVFTVYTLLQIDPNATQNDTSEIIRRAIELTWQGTMTESQGADVLNIAILVPGQVPTLDNGLSFVGIVALNAQITRADAVAYLSQRPHTYNDFIGLVAEGTLTIEQPEEIEYYEGQPNHPVFMLTALEAQITGRQETPAR